MGCGACSSTLTGIKTCTIGNSAVAAGTTTSDAPPAVGTIYGYICLDGYYISSPGTCSLISSSSLLSETGSLAAGLANMVKVTTNSGYN
jgi:hypothetical protein